MSDPARKDEDIDSTEEGTANDSAPNLSDKYLYDVDWDTLNHAREDETRPPIGEVPIAGSPAVSMILGEQ